MRPLPSYPALFYILIYIWFLFSCSFLLSFLLLFVLSHMMSFSFPRVLPWCLHTFFLSHFSTALFIFSSSLTSCLHLSSLPVFSSLTLSPRNPLMSIKVRIMRGNISGAYTHSGWPCHALYSHGLFGNESASGVSSFKGNGSRNLKCPLLFCCW